MKVQLPPQYRTRNVAVPPLPAQWLEPLPDLAEIESRVLAYMNAPIETVGPKLALPPGLDLTVNPTWEQQRAADAPAEIVEPPEDKREKVSCHASYLSVLFDEPGVAIKRFKRKMRAVDFDTLVGIGTSGTLAAQLFASAIGCDFAIVRKPNVSTHSSNDIEGNVGRRWVFVDDLIASGDTRRRVIAAMRQFCERHNFKSTYVGDYLYYGNSFRDRETQKQVEGDET